MTTEDDGGKIRAWSSPGARSPASGLPPVLRSRHALAQSGISTTLPDAEPPSTLPIATDGVTYTMAQEAAWLDADHFAVGRWDGSLTVFSFVDSPSAGPLITVSASDPSSEGVQMIVPLTPRMFVSSCGDSQLCLWKTADADWRSIRPRPLDFDPELGAANSGAVTSSAEGAALAVGHANGFLSTWVVDAEHGTLVFGGAIDLRSPHPVNPWNLHNVRGAAEIEPMLVVAGSEDGLLSLVRLPRTVLLQQVYNPTAQRGINCVSLSNGTDLLVGNCAVGADDFNLWLFTLDPQSPTLGLSDRVNLRVNPAAPQVFDFCATWAACRDGRCFFASTEEGALWMGTIRSGRLDVLGYKEVTSQLGAALAYQPGGRLVMVGHDLYEFDTGA